MPKFLGKFFLSIRLPFIALSIHLHYLLWLKSIFLFITSLLLIGIQSCDILDSDNNHSIDPPIYPCPYQDVSISPEGQHLIFFRTKVTSLYRDGTGEYEHDSTGIWRCNIKGISLQLLFNSDWNSNSPQFIPQSQSILFNFENHIVKVPFNDRLIDETDLIFLTDAAENFYPSVSGDGSIISYDSNFDSPNGMFFIWVMNVDGSNKKRVAYDPENGEIRMPSIYPSTDQIFHIRYVKNNDGSPEIFKMDIDGNNIKQLTFNSRFNKLPRANFEANRILFISDRKLFSIDTSGTDLIQLTDFDVQSACWTPDNKIIYVKYNAWEFSYNNGTVWIMSAEGLNKQQITYNYGLELKGGN